MSSSLRSGSTAPSRPIGADVSMAQRGDVEPWRLAEADYRAVTVRLILGNMGRGDDPAEGVRTLAHARGLAHGGADQRHEPASTM
jgi:hypothetical protein